jgi:hypothetical protein
VDDHVFLFLPAVNHILKNVNSCLMGRHTTLTWY